MTFNEIKELVQLVSDSKLRTIEISADGFNIKMSKNTNDGVNQTAAKEMHIEAAAESSNFCFEEKAEICCEKKEEVTGNIVTAPIVGTFYSKSGPTTTPFVKKGDHVKKGDTLCIIEAMKIMNEIVSNFDGIVEDIYVKDEELVEYGQKLFNIV